MRLVSIGAALFLGISCLAADEVREFSLRTKERVGHALTVASRRPDQGASDPVRKRARDTAVVALHRKTYTFPYDLLVVDDPDSRGFLVYAEPVSRKSPNLLGGDIRITVSPDGSKALRVEQLCKRVSTNRPDPKGTALIFLAAEDFERDVPLETLIYRSASYRFPIFIFMRDKSLWLVTNETMVRLGNENLQEATKALKFN